MAGASAFEVSTFSPAKSECLPAIWAFTYYLFGIAYLGVTVTSASPLLRHAGHFGITVQIIRLP